MNGNNLDKLYHNYFFHLKWPGLELGDTEFNECYKFLPVGPTEENVKFSEGRKNRLPEGLGDSVTILGETFP